MSPEAIRAVLGDFERWLTEAAPEPAPSAPTFDAASVLAQFVALRQEVNLQTRAMRAQQEQAAQALDLAQRAVARAEAAEKQQKDESLRPLLMSIIEAHDALSHAGQQVAKAEEPPPAAKPRSWWRWWAGNSEPAPAPKLAAGLAQGYDLSLQRLARILSKHGVEPVLAVGRPFDPERMEAVEGVEGTGKPAGEVLDEVRKGWEWQGRTLRVAQVRVAR